MKGGFVSCWPVLSPLICRGPATTAGRPFPLDDARRFEFHVARGGIYHLMRALWRGTGGAVLMPDYHSGTEVWAVRAAGVPIVFYHVNRRLEIDLDEIRRLCARDPVALYLIHYLGWPQPVEAVRDLCRDRGIPLIEDCALSLLSRTDSGPLGSFGDFAIFCLYKTLPVPNGGLLVLNRGQELPDLRGLVLKRCGRAAVVGRALELLFRWVRGRSGGLGAALLGAKTAAGRLLDRLGVARLPVGDISPGFSTAGYDPGRLDTAMAPLSAAILDRLDYPGIVRTRRENYRRLASRLAGRVPLVRRDMPEGVCPLFLPILVRDKSAAAQRLRARGIEAVEFWNYGHPEAGPGVTGADAAFLRRHLLELPIHQDVTPGQVDFMADQVLRLEACR